MHIPMRRVEEGASEERVLPPHPCLAVVALHQVREYTTPSTERPSLPLQAGHVGALPMGTRLGFSTVLAQLFLRPSHETRSERFKS